MLQGFTWRLPDVTSDSELLSPNINSKKIRCIGHDVDIMTSYESGWSCGKADYGDEFRYTAHYGDWYGVPLDYNKYHVSYGYIQADYVTNEL